MSIERFFTAGEEYTTYEKAVPAPLFNISFECVNTTAGAYIDIAVIGFYDLFVNGKKITKGLLAPYVSNPEHLVYYDRYELEDKLKVGRNNVCILLGNGFVNNPGGQIWDFDKASYRAAPALAFDLFTGERHHDAGDSMWKRSALLFDDYRCGIVWDATKLVKRDFTGYGTVGTWHTPTPISEDRRIGEIRRCNAEPIRVREELAPVSIHEGGICNYVPRGDTYNGPTCLDGDDFDAGFIFDFGKISAGTARLRINGRAGQRISLRFGELLDENGNLDINNINFFPKGFVQRAVYICRGEENETFEIPFTYYGCRYCHIHGADKEQISKDTVTFLPACSDVQRLASFECSSDILNKLFAICRESDLDNLYYFPTDCPQREKNGWTGDASESCEHMLLNLGIANTLNVWMDSIIRAQAENGSLPGIVPTGGWGFKWGNGPAWDRVIVNVPYYVYKYTGDKTCAEKCVETIYRYLVYVNGRRDENGLLDIGLGDYCQSGCNPSKPTTPILFTDSAVTFDICNKAAMLFDLVNAPAEYSEYAKALAASLRESIRAHLLNKEDMSLSHGTQTAQSFGLTYGIFNEDEVDKALNRLVLEIEKDGEVMNVGFLGSRTVLHTLSRYGRTDLAYKMIMSEKQPSYADIIRRGFTAMPERFDTADMKVKYCSFDHHFHADVCHWLIDNVLGMSVNPDLSDPNSVYIKPCTIADVAFARGERIMPNGRVEVSYERDENGTSLSVKTEGSVTVRLDPVIADKITKNENGCICIHF